MYTLIIYQTAARHSEASFHVTNKLNKRTNAWWDNFVSETVFEFSHEPRIGLYKLANELRVNPYT